MFWLPTRKRATTIPQALRCRWTSRGGSERDVYDCPDCGCWTANLPLYKLDVCEAKDRRKGKPDRRGVHHQDSRK